MMKGGGDATSAAASQIKKLDDGGELVFVTNLVAHQALIKTQSEKAKAAIPPGMSKFMTVLDHVQTIGVRLNLSDKQLLKAILSGKDAAGAKEIHTLAGEALGMGQGLFKQFEPFIRQGFPPSMKGLMDMLAAAVKGAKVSASANDVALTIPKPEGFDNLPELLKPVIEAAAAQRRELKKANNLKMVAIAIEMYQASQGRLPTNVVDKNGKPILSWRVQILPYMEKNELAQQLALQFKNDEPWDSEANKKLLTKMPEYYGDNKQGIATILSFNGKRPTKFSEIAAGTSNTVFGLLVDEASGVPWTKPADLDATPEAVLKAVKESKSQRFLTLFYDGGIRPLPKSIGTADLKAMIDYKNAKGRGGRSKKQPETVKKRSGKKG